MLTRKLLSANNRSSSQAGGYEAVKARLFGCLARLFRSMSRDSVAAMKSSLQQEQELSTLACVYVRCCAAETIISCFLPSWLARAALSRGLFMMKRCRIRSSMHAYARRRCMARGFSRKRQYSSECMQQDSTAQDSAVVAGSVHHTIEREVTCMHAHQPPSTKYVGQALHLPAQAL